MAPSSNENATMAGKKTIQPQDVMAALKEHEFDSFLPRLEAELQSTYPPVVSMLRATSMYLELSSAEFPLPSDFLYPPVSDRPTDPAQNTTPYSATSAIPTDVK